MLSCSATIASGWSAPGLLRLRCSRRVLFATLSHVVPAADQLQTISRVRIDCRRARRSSRPRAVAESSRRALSKETPTSSGCSSGSMSAPARQHRAQGGPQDHQHRVRARADAEAGASRRRPRQFHEPERWRPGTGGRDIMLVPRRRRSRTADRGGEQDRRGNGDALRAARAARPGRPGPARDQSSSRASTWPPTSA